MDDINKIAIFLVGLGAPASLYADYIEDLKKRLPKTKIMILEWWNQNDFGINALESSIGNSSVLLIGHSAGSVIALQALAKWPHLIKKIIMLDSHFQRTQSALPSVSGMLDIMLSKDNSAIQSRVKNAYRPLIENSLVFNSALTFAIEWVNASFDQMCTMLKAMPVHSILVIAFTNSSYQALTAENKHTLLATWEKWGVDVKFLAMNHFDLIDNKEAAVINQLVKRWLDL